MSRHAHCAKLGAHEFAMSNASIIKFGCLLSTAKQGDYRIGSVRPSVRPSVCLSVCPAKSNRGHYQSKVIVCVSVISRRVRLIARMRSIGVLIVYMFMDI